MDPGLAFLFGLISSVIMFVISYVTLTWTEPGSWVRPVAFVIALGGVIVMIIAMLIIGSAVVVEVG